MPPPDDDSFEQDMARVAAVAGYDPGDVKGYTLVVYLHIGKTAVVSTGCCLRHALNDVTCLAEDRTPDMVQCSGEV